MPQRALTGDRPALTRALGQIETAQQTRIHLGIEKAHEELLSARHREGNALVMIVLTDGRANPDPAEWAVERADAAKVQDIVIFTIGIGPELDVDALERMASKPQYFYQAPDADELADIYPQIAVEIPCPTGQFWGGRP